MKGEIKLKRNRSSFSAAAVKERVFFGLLFLHRIPAVRNGFPVYGLQPERSISALCRMCYLHFAL